MKYLDVSALSLGERLKKREIGVREVTQAALSRIAKKDGEYRAYLSVFQEAALAQANAVQKQLDAG